MDAFVEQYSYIAFILVFVAEFLIGKSKMKSNSTIELAIKVVRFVFRLDKSGVASEKKTTD